jgi:hypothetical protein
MSRRYHQTNHNTEATSLAQSRAKVNLAWLAALAAFVFYFFSLFFSNIEWDALAGY